MIRLKMPSPPIEALGRHIQLLSLNARDFLAACKRESFQGSGPGGQKRNRVYSGVRLTLDDLFVTAAEHRESERNKKAAVHRLRVKIALRADSFCMPEELSLGELEAARSLPLETQSFQPAFRVKINPAHFDFPRCVLTACVLLRAGRADVRGAAGTLGVTNSALIKFLKLDKSVFSHANHLRALYDRHPLR